MIVAMTRDRVIGRNGGMPWKLSRDLKRFRDLTMGHHLIMGRKTLESLGRALPGRTSIVVTRRPESLSVPDGVICVANLETALALTEGDPEPFVIGGGEIYQFALPVTKRVYATWIEASVRGDVFFPEFPTSDWRLLEQTPFPADEKNEHATTFCVYERAR